jgi:hypothetical protein
VQEQSLSHGSGPCHAIGYGPQQELHAGISRRRESLQRLQRPGVTRPIREFCELPILKPAENSKPTEETIPTPIKLHESA